MGSDWAEIVVHWRIYSFNSRSRMGSDERPEEDAEESAVSIHAPAWGATAVR